MKSFNLAGDENLGIERVDDPQSPYHGHVPIPTVLDAQIDRLLIEGMAKLKKSTLAKLTSMIIGNKRRENWYMILLTTLVLLFNVGVIHQHQLIQKERYQKSVSSKVL